MQLMLDGVIQVLVDELFVHGMCLQQNAVSPFLDVPLQLEGVGIRLDYATTLY